MDERFLRAFTDPAAQSKILGRLVSPFSLRHRVTLVSLNSPFTKQSGDFRPLDLLVAVKVCAGEPIGKLTNAELGEIIELSDNPKKFIDACIEFKGFMLEDNHPKFWQKDTGRAGTNGVPWVLNIIATLTSNGVPYREAWDMPECQAIWMATAFASMKGAELKVLTTEDEYLQANFNKILKRN
jgi:hypothetical protein